MGELEVYTELMEELPSRSSYHAASLFSQTPNEGESYRLVLIITITMHRATISSRANGYSRECTMCNGGWGRGIQNRGQKPKRKAYTFLDYQNLRILAVGNTKCTIDIVLVLARTGNVDLVCVSWFGV